MKGKEESANSEKEIQKREIMQTMSSLGLPYQRNRSAEHHIDLLLRAQAYVEYPRIKVTMEEIKRKGLDIFPKVTQKLLNGELSEATTYLLLRSSPDVAMPITEIRKKIEKAQAAAKTSEAKVPCKDVA